MPRSWNESFLLYWNSTTIFIEQGEMLGTSWSSTWERNIAALVALASINTTSNQMVALGNKIVSLLNSGVNQTEQLYLQQLWNSTMSAFNFTAMTSVAAANAQYRTLYTASNMLDGGGSYAGKSAIRCTSYNQSIASLSSLLATLQQNLSLCKDNFTCQADYETQINITGKLLEVASENFDVCAPYLSAMEQYALETKPFTTMINYHLGAYAAVCADTHSAVQTTVALDPFGMSLLYDLGVQELESEWQSLLPALQMFIYTSCENVFTSTLY